ncbi:hypothetical protein FRC08_003605 [Ceratobasidium sp. 394]|nr:hypothetical protein FRC08_003605 [Ceratobasidium sp. 394]KAG9084250.1 hypothetical protein FS749_005371 [Ceratobasidium sp. UAMH 11750]
MSSQVAPRTNNGYEKGGEPVSERPVEEEIKTVRMERDMQGVTVDGFNTLGIVSTFIAGVEAQCLSFTADPEGHRPSVVEAINALLLIGVLLSTFGAITALLAGRWFNLLNGPEVELLDHRWSCARPDPTGEFDLGPGEDQALERKFGYTPEGRLPSPHIQKMIERCTRHKRNMILAKAIFLPLHLIILGFFSFVMGLVIYTWEFRPLGTAIACTFVTAVGVAIIISLHVDFETMGALNMMSFKRPRL